MLMLWAVPVLTGETDNDDSVPDASPTGSGASLALLAGVLCVVSLDAGELTGVEGDCCVSGAGLGGVEEGVGLEGV